MSTRLVGIAAALGCASIWGLTFVPTKVVMSEMGPFTLAVLRFSVALAAIVVAIAFTDPGVFRLRKGSWGTLTAAAFTGVTLFFGFQNLSLERTSATDAGLISGSVPAITAAMSALVLKERISLQRASGVVLSVAGIAAVVLGGDASRGGSTLEGDIFMVGSSISWAVYTMLVKRLRGKLPDTLLLVSTMAIGTLFLLPPAGLELAARGIGPITTGGIASVLFLGLFGSAASFFCWNAALVRLDASEAAVYLNLVPVITVVSAALLLGERLAPVQGFGGILVLGGVYLAGRQ